MSLYKYFKIVNISASLLDPKGHLSDHVPTASNAEANIEVLKAVAKAKEPQKRYFLRHVSIAVVPLHITTAKGLIMPALKKRSGHAKLKDGGGCVHHSNSTALLQ